MCAIDVPGDARLSRAFRRHFRAEKTLLFQGILERAVRPSAKLARFPILTIHKTEAIRPLIWRFCEVSYHESIHVT